MILLCVILAVALILLVRHYWLAFRQAPVTAELGRFWPWFLKGFILPWFVLALFDFGLFPGIPPLLSRIPVGGMAGWTHLDAWVREEFVLGLFLASAWSAFSLAWIFFQNAVARPDRSALGSLCLAWGIPGMMAGGLLLAGLGWPALGFALTILFTSLSHGLLDLADRPLPEPHYSRAIGHLKLGRTEDAEWETLRELERFPDDFQGWMLLAEIYAVHYRDLRLAERTVYELCEQQNITLSQTSMALHQLADWHLRLADDLAGARFALEEIRRRMPDTHLAKMAGYRLRQLPANQEALVQSHQPRKIRLTTLQEADRNIEAPFYPDLDPGSAQAMAQDCVDRLNRVPDDTASRERLARLYAEHLDQPKLGIEQLQLLIAQPDQPDAKVAGWLALQARWQERYRHDHAASQALLKRIIRDYPRSLHAFAAHRKLSLMRDTPP